MALYTTLASLSQTAASNVADGATDAPSTIDQQTNLLASFIAQLRDGVGLTTGVGYLAQCRLTKSGANLLLSRYNGVGLTINGVAYAIPSAGITLAPTALSVGTLYYIYAYMNAGVMTLEASTTGHSTDTASGIEIKTGDATRTLVGMARPITGPAWTDTVTQRFVVSWFNPQALTLNNAITGNLPASNTTYVELDSSKRIEFLSWSGKAVNATAALTGTNSVIGANMVVSIGFDGTTAQDIGGFKTQAGTGEFVQLFAQANNSTLSEGYHYATMLERQTGGTTTWQGGATVGERCAITGVIQG